MVARRAKLTACALLVASCPALIGTTGRMSNWQARVLASQNLERASLGIPPLSWDPGLAASADGWASYLARTGQFAHAPENRFRPEGENIWGGTKGYFPAEAMTGAWIAEKRHFVPGKFPNNSNTGRVEDVGHYTQLVWRSSRRMGCAVEQSNKEDLLVCRYSEAGNWLGEKPF